MLESSQTVMFLHIPKTGGSTINEILSRQYRQSKVYHIDSKWGVPENLRRFTALPKRQRASYDLVAGHMKFGWHQYIPCSSTYFTLLRNPMDRVLSLYYYVFQTPDHYLFDLVKKQGKSLETLLAERITSELENHQTRMLANVDDQQVPFGCCTMAMLDTAKHNLEKHFSVVGLLERFDETLLLLRKVFGWRVPLYVRRNVTRSRKKQSNVRSELVQSIVEHNKLDIELYEYAEERFASQMKSLGLFPYKLTAFKKLNFLYNKIYAFYHGL